MPAQSQAGLFFELAQSHRLRILTVSVLALRNGPDPRVLPGEVRSARMHEQHVELARAAAKQDQARASLRHRSERTHSCLWDGLVAEVNPEGCSSVNRGNGAPNRIQRHHPFSLAVWAS